MRVKGIQRRLLESLMENFSTESRESSSKRLRLKHPIEEPLKFGASNSLSRRDCELSELLPWPHHSLVIGCPSIVYAMR